MIIDNLSLAAIVTVGAVSLLILAAAVRSRNSKR